MRLRKVIQNAVPNKSVVRQYNRDDLKTCINEVVYALPPYKALISYYMQFIVKDFIYENYPRTLKGVTTSSKVKDIFYLKCDEYVLRSLPLLNGDKMRFRSGKPNKAVMPKRKGE